MKEDVGGGTQRRHRTTLKVTTRKSTQLLSKANPTIRNGPGNLGATVKSLPTCPKILKIKLKGVGTEVWTLFGIPFRMELEHSGTSVPPAEVACWEWLQGVWLGFSAITVEKSLRVPSEAENVSWRDDRILQPANCSSNSLRGKR